MINLNLLSLGVPKDSLKSMGVSGTQAVKYCQPVPNPYPVRNLSLHRNYNSQLLMLYYFMSIF